VFSSIQGTSAASRRGSLLADVGVASRSGRLAVDLPDVRRGRTVDRNPARLHGLGDLARQFDLQQAVVERGSLDLDIVRQIELALEGPRRNSLVQELALCSAVIAISSAEKLATASEIW
jgi:hypothetical protein